MQKSLQFALVISSILIFASAALAQEVTVRRSLLFQVQPPLIAQEYAPYPVLPSMIWRAPILPLTWDMQAPFTLDEISALDRAPKPN